MPFLILTVDQLIGALEKYNHKELHVHHTWSPNHSYFNGSNHIQLQQNMKNYHVYSRGWSDIGQHVTLTPDGKFVTGRDFGRTPASIKGYNTGGFAVEMLGNFDKGHDKFDGVQKAAMLKLAAYFYGKNRYIRFHRENAPKTCPGTSISKSVFMNEVKQVANGGNVSSGLNVTELQLNLMKLGFDLPKYGADGDYGDETIAAVKAFQKKYGLKVDGVAGEQTLAKIEELLKVSNPPQEQNNVDEGDDKLMLHDWQWDMLVENLKLMHQDGTLSSDDWYKKAEKKQLTLSELAFLNNVIVTRKLNK